MADLDETISELNKRFGKNTIIAGNSIKGIELPRVSTGSLSLDVETGGGLPFGRVIELFGRESTGKSFMSMKTVAEVQKLGRKAVWVDVEGSFDPAWAELLGVDIEKLMLVRPETGEIAGDILDAVIRSGDCGIVVLDSTAALIPAADAEKAMEDVEQIGTRAKMVNRLIRKVHAGLNMRVEEGQCRNDCLVIFVNQIREKVGVMYGSPDTTPGGLGLRHAASIRIEFRKTWLKDEEDKDKVLGQTVNFVVQKNKTYPPLRRGQFNFFTDGPQKGQIDLASEVLTYGTLAGVITQSGRTYTIGKEKVVGQAEALEVLKRNPELVMELRTKILERQFPKNESKKTS